MLLSSFQIYWQILSENTILKYENILYSNKNSQNTSCAAKVSETFGILSNSATGSFGTISMPDLDPKACSFS
jgi:hypothetical protein